MIRKYQDSDIEDVIDIWHQASLVAHPFLSESFLEREEGKIRDIYMRKAKTWVYEKQNKAVGFISLIGHEVGGLFVHPAMHRQGIGKELMDKACSLHASIELDVFKANFMGRSFYAKYGFKAIAEFVHDETGQPTIRLKYST